MTEAQPSLLERFMRAQLQGDRREALRLVLDEGVARGISPEELQLEVVQAAQHEIGELWARNEIGIAQEHVATAVANLVLTALYSHLPLAPRNGRRVLVACVEGKLHELGARISADFLEAAGFDVTLAGANVPTVQLVELSRLKQSELVALSVTMPHHLPALGEAVRALRTQHGPRLPIAAGGRALGKPTPFSESLAVLVHGTDAKALVSAAQRELAVATC